MTAMTRLSNSTIRAVLFLDRDFYRFLLFFLDGSSVFPGPREKEGKVRRKEGRKKERKEEKKVILTASQHAPENDPVAADAVGLPPCPVVFSDYFYR